MDDLFKRIQEEVWPQVGKQFLEESLKLFTKSQKHWDTFIKVYFDIPENERARVCFIQWEHYILPKAKKGELQLNGVTISSNGHIVREND